MHPNPLSTLKAITRLQQLGIITISEPKSVTQFP
jgi:hypothetical protein